LKLPALEQFKTQTHQKQEEKGNRKSYREFSVAGYNRAWIAAVNQLDSIPHEEVEALLSKI
jgi:hypothetical protein